MSTQDSAWIGALRAEYAAASTAPLAAPRYSQSTWFTKAQAGGLKRPRAAAFDRRLVVIGALAVVLFALPSHSINPVRWVTNTAASARLCASHLGHGDVVGCLGEFGHNHDASPSGDVRPSTPVAGSPVPHGSATAAITPGPKSPPGGSTPPDPTPVGGPTPVRATPGASAIPGPGPQSSTPPTPARPPGPTPYPWSTSPFSYWNPFDTGSGSPPPDWTQMAGQQPGSDGWIVGYGGLVNTVDGAEHTITLNGSGGWTNYNTWAWMRLYPNDSGGIDFRWNGNGNAYQCMLGNGRLSLSAIGSSGGHELAGMALTYPSDGGTTLQLRAVAQGNYVACIVNDSSTVSATDSTNPTGGIAIQSYGKIYVDAVQAKSSP